MKKVFLVLLMAFSVTACQPQSNSDAKDREAVERQQGQYQAAQPIPAFDWSLERELTIQLYQVRNSELTTHSVWRSDYGLVEGDCLSMGYGLPYDTSLTNPLKGVRISSQGGVTSVGQAEPNGVFASTNTSATWVFCIGDSGTLEPVYVESRVTVYPGPVEIDYTTNRVRRAGEASVSINAGK